jgi:predicted urease superfamily metal-dependent hydrolase
LAIGESAYCENIKIEKYNKQTGNVKKKLLDHFADDDSKQTKKIMIFKNVYGLNDKEQHI